LTVTWYDSADDPITAAIALSAEQGTTGAAVELRAWNNRGGVGASTRSDLYLEALEVVADVPLSSGTEALDQHHVEARVVEGLNQVAPPSAWTRIGTARFLPVPSLANDTGVKFEVRLSPPAHATSTQVTVRFHLIERSQRPIPTGITQAAGAGIYHGLGDGAYSAIASFGGLAENGTPDNQVTVGDLRWIYQGRPYALLAHLTAFDDLDSAAEALTAGQGYIAVGTAADGVLNWTKGLRSASPTAPTAPAGELLIGEVLVEFDATINTADLTEQWLMGFFGFKGSSALSATFGAGDAVLADRLVHRDGEQSITLADDDESAVYLMPDGSLAATVDGTRPDVAAEYLADVTAASGAISDADVVDRRRLTPGPQVIALVSPPGEIAVDAAAHGANPSAREFGLLPTRPVSLWLHDDGNTLTGGESRVDVEHSVDAATWNSLYNADDDMPDVAFDETPPEDHASLPDVLVIPALAQVRARVDAVPTGGGGETLPAGYTVALRGWPL
jgi:hypothetical protein